MAPCHVQSKKTPTHTSTFKHIYILYTHLYYYIHPTFLNKYLLSYIRLMDHAALMWDNNASWRCDWSLFWFMFMHSSPIQMHYNLWLKFDIIATSPHTKKERYAAALGAQIKNAMPINMNHSNDHLACLSPSFFNSTKSKDMLLLSELAFTSCWPRSVMCIEPSFW